MATSSSGRIAWVASWLLVPYCSFLWKSGSPDVPAPPAPPSPATSRPHLLEPLEVPHGRHCVALHQDVAAGEQLQSLEGGAVGPNQALPPLHKLLLVANHAANLDDVTLHLVLQHLERLQGGRVGGVVSKSGVFQQAEVQRRASSTAD